MGVKLTNFCLGLLLGAPLLSRAASEVFLQAPISAVAIQRAIDTLPSGGYVHLPPGVTTLKAPLVLGHSNLHVVGETNTVLRLADNANCPVVIMGEPVNHPTVLSNLWLEGVAIDGNQQHQKYECWVANGPGNEIRNNGVTVQGIIDSVVTNISCFNCRSGGLVATLGVSNLLVSIYSGCSNRYDGLACYNTRYSTFRYLTLSANRGAGISLDTHFDWNKIWDVSMSGNDIGIFMRNSQHNDIARVHLTHPASYGVFLSKVDNLASTSAARNSFTNIDVRDCAKPVWINSSGCLDNVFVAIFPPNGIQVASSVAGALRQF